MTERALDPWRALVRLWAVGSAAWIAFWLWRDVTGCVVAGNGALYRANSGWIEPLRRRDFVAWAGEGRRP